MDTVSCDQVRNQFDWRLVEYADSSSCAEEFRTEERILMAAANLFANKGYAGTSVREIVDVAGVTKPTLYYYFKNKEDLYRKLMDQTIETFFALLEESLSKEGDIRSRLIAFYSEINQLLHRNIDFLRLVNSMIYGPQGATPEYDLKSRNAHFEKMFSELLQAAVAEGELREDKLEEVNLLLLGLMRSIQVHLVVKPMQQAIKPQTIGRVIDLIFDGARA